MRHRFTLGLLGLLLFLTPSVGWASEHVGQVMLGGAPVPGVVITATRGEAKASASTDQRGMYRFPDLADGVWTMRADMFGFMPITRDVTVARNAQPQSWELTVRSFADITRDVPVTRAAPAPTERRPAAANTSQRNAPTGSSQARDATPPAAGPAALAARAGGPGTPTLPGGAVPPGALPPGAAPGRAGGPGPVPPADAAGGQAASGNSFLVSGTVNSGVNTPSLQNGAAADAARRALGLRLYNASVATQLGSSLFDSKPHSFTGRPSSQPDYRDVNFTGTFSGPIRIPGLMRTTRNLSLNYNRTSNSDASTSAEQMPTLLQRLGDFSQTVDGFGNAVQITDPRTGAPFPGNAIPADRISSQATALLGYYPLADIAATSNYNYEIPRLSSRVSDRVNGSMTLTSNNRYSLGVNGGYSHNSNESTSLFGFDNESHGYGVDGTVNYQWRTGNTALQRFTYSYNRSENTTDPFFANRVNVSGDAGITGNNQDPVNWGPPTLTFSSGIAGLSDVQYSSNRTQTHNWTGEAQRVYGRHNLTFGGNARYLMTDLVSQQNARGGFTFNGTVTGYDFADFLLGVPATSSIAFGNADKQYRAWNQALYVTDDFRVSPTLTIQAGLRWDHESPVTEGQDRLVNLDIAPGFTAVAPVIASDGIGPLTGRRYSDALVGDDLFGLQPRLGVAWRPSPMKSFIVRGGYGVYRNSGVYQSLATMMAQQPPLSDTFNAVNSPSTPLSLADGFIPPASTTLNTFAVDPDFRVGFVQRWQAGLQFDLPAGLSMSNTYAAGRGSNLLQAFLPNTYAPGAVNPCPSCPSGFVYLTSQADSMSHAWQVQLRRRLRSGLTWTTAYTLSKTTDNAAGFSTSGLSGAIGGAGVNGVSIAQDWLNLDAERGPSSFDQRHLLAVQAQYTTGQGVAGGALLTGWKGALVKGWSISSQLSTGSGMPYTPVYRGTPVAGFTGTMRASLTGASLTDIPDGYFANPDAFMIPETGTWGTASRNSIRGPRTFSLDASFSRAFTLSQRMTFEWTTNVTNLLNVDTYSSINAIVGASQFGLPTGTTPARRIRSSLRWRF